MYQFFYKILLVVLRALMYGKRAVFCIGRYAKVGLFCVVQWYRKTIGFFFYKIGFLLKRQLQKLRVPFDGRLIDILGKRGTLQIILAAVIFVIMMPHSTLYTKDGAAIPGRDTLLYQLAGESEFDLKIDEVQVGSTENLPKETRTWREGAVIAEKPVTDEKVRLVTTPKEITSISAGGSALTKPTILPGAELPNLPSAPAPAGVRHDMVLYEVQPGDVIGKIAEQYGISITTVLWANNLTTRSYIRPGDQLKIPPADGVMHTIVRGDTVSKIARLYSAEQDEIIAFNRLQSDGRDLVIGEDIFVIGGERPRAVYTAPVQSSPLKNVAAPTPSVSVPAGSGYVWPTAAGVITQYYHWRHTAIDIGAPIGTPIYATRAGAIIKSQCGWNGGYGCYVMIDHGGGVQSLYGHNSQLFVSVGDVVTQGQAIAAMGSTGNSTGPHLHFEVRVNGVQQNPLKYVRQ